MGRVVSGAGAKHVDYSPVVLFDGVCHLCNRSVKFLIRRDKKGIIHYAALQSDYARRRIKEAGIPEPLPDGVILIEEGRYYTESDAVLRSLHYLGPFYRFVSLFRIIPKFIRQFFYGIIARNRYRWFGKYDACVLPEPGWKERFEDQEITV
ncbi:MAG: thiol-disulfide oxidoreductase DCC family protein [Bacteroidia bacterium]